MEDPKPSALRLLSLPQELISHICEFMTPEALAALTRTCKYLLNLGRDDRLWRLILAKSLPQTLLTTPKPYSSFRELYAAHHPYWFLVKGKIWFGDVENIGSLIMVCYDPTRGCIEGYQIVAERPSMDPLYWNHPSLPDSLEPLAPKTQLHRDLPVLHLKGTHDFKDKRNEVGYSGCDDEVVMPSESFRFGIQHSTLIPAVALPRAAQSHGTAVWPPYILPAKERVRNDSLSGFRAAGHRPKSRSQLCQEAFRIRKWLKPAVISALMASPADSIVTYSTISPDLYEPTPEKPYQGIWVGDYAGHGCEFFLFRHVLDKESTATSKSPSKQREQMSGEFATGESQLRGRLEAIKLVGDPHVPRGEYTWIADEIGDAGLVRIAEEKAFQGARVVRAKGQIAMLIHFRNVKFINVQLILISNDQVAVHWKAMNPAYVTLYNRVSLEALEKPLNKPLNPRISYNS